MDVGENTTGGDSDAAKELIELLIVTNRELNMARDNPGLLIVPCGIAGQLENLGSEVLHHGGHVDWCTGTDTIGVPALAKESVNTTYRELQPGLAGARLRGLLDG